MPETPSERPRHVLRRRERDPRRLARRAVRAHRELGDPRNADRGDDDTREQAVRQDSLAPLGDEHGVRGQEQKPDGRVRDEQHRVREPVERPRGTRVALERPEQEQRRDEARRERAADTRAPAATT